MPLLLAAARRRSPAGSTSAALGCVPPCPACAHWGPRFPTASGASQKRGHSGGGGGGGGDGWGSEKRQRTDAWKTPEDIPSNGGFEEYYKEQGVCPPEVRWRPRRARRGCVPGLVTPGACLWAPAGSSGGKQGACRPVCA